MKRRTMLFIMIITLILGTTVSVAAIYRDDIYAKKMIKQGYTEEDMLNLDAILYLSEENVRGLIVQKYDELKDWKKVREYYGVDEGKYENYMIGKKMQQETLNSIPSYIFDEMEDRGWTRSEINDFVNKTNISRIDYEYAWKECKNGRMVDDVVEEKIDVDREKSELATEFARGEMPVEEYETRLKEILGKDVVRETDKTDNMIADAVAELIEKRENTRKRHKERSGITDEEINYCKSQGMTNPMDMYQAKNISKSGKIPLEKVVASKLKNKEWTKATAEVLGISHSEYKQQNEKAKME